MVQVLNFYVTKIRVIKTGLQLAKTVKLCNNAVQRATQSSFVILPFVATALFQGKSYLFYWSTIYRSIKRVLNPTLDFINTHLQQQDQVPSILCRFLVNRSSLLGYLCA